MKTEQIFPYSAVHRCPPVALNLCNLIFEVVIINFVSQRGDNGLHAWRGRLKPEPVVSVIVNDDLDGQFVGGSSLQKFFERLKVGFDSSANGERGCVFVPRLLNDAEEPNFSEYPHSNIFLYG